MGAVEAVKAITGMGELMTGRLLRMDFRQMTFQTMKIASRTVRRLCSITHPSYNSDCFFLEHQYPHRPVNN